jgi:hypothetical protein
MKCELCLWDEMPNVIPKAIVHAKTDHRDVSGISVVWRDPDLVLTTDPQKDDTTLTYYWPA